MKNLSVKNVIELVVLAVIAVVVIYTIVQFVCNFRYNPELGIYDTRAYSFTIKQIMQGNDVTYTYTDLNVWQILDRIY